MQRGTIFYISRRSVKLTTAADWTAGANKRHSLFHFLLFAWCALVRKTKLQETLYVSPGGILSALPEEDKRFQRQVWQNSGLQNPQGPQILCCVFKERADVADSSWGWTRARCRSDTARSKLFCCCPPLHLWPSRPEQVWHRKNRSSRNILQRLIESPRMATKEKYFLTPVHLNMFVHFCLLHACQRPIWQQDSSFKWFLQIKKWARISRFILCASESV